MKKFARFAGPLLALCVAMSASAHHSFAMFEMSKTVTIEGTVREVQWTNPHIWIQILVKDPANGQDVEWSIEGDSPNVLTRRGWNRKSIQAGDRASIDIHPLKSGVDHGGSLAGASVNGKRIGNVVEPPRSEGAKP
jgi:hypothetical protein